MLHLRAPARSVLLRPLGARLFQSLGVSAALVERLRAAGITSPSAAQQRAIPLLVGPPRRATDVVIAAETGGGKTLAYLVPVLERLQRHAVPLAQVHRPVVLVLTTSQELVGQIAQVLRALDADAARFTTALSSAQQQLPTRGGACALLIATPKALLRATKPRDFAFTELIVVDEADMLLGGGFERDTKQILATIRNQPLQKAQLNTREQQDRLEGRELRADDVSDATRQTVFTYATIPDYGKRSVRDYIDYKFPNAEFAVTDDFHRTLPRLDIAVHRLEDHETSEQETDLDLPRKQLLLQILEQAAKQQHEKQPHTLVFANSIESADAVHAFLTSHYKTGGDILLYHKEISRDARRAILTRLEQQPDGAGLVVVCTDIAARGLDTTRVGHVVQYEFANDVVSYIHRIGRTARAGTSGKVSSIVSEHNALVLSKIQEAGGDSLDGAFSRKRSLRKKVKKLRREAHSPQ